MEKGMLLEFWGPWGVWQQEGCAPHSQRGRSEGSSTSERAMQEQGVCGEEDLLQRRH